MAQLRKECEITSGITFKLEDYFKDLDLQLKIEELERQAEEASDEITREKSLRELMTL